MNWNKFRIYSVLLVAALAWPVSQAAVLASSSLPDGSNWYLHVNLDLIQNSDAGRQLMLGTVNEALEGIEEELGVGFADYIEGVTIFGGSFPNHGDSLSDTAIVLHGAISEADQQILLEKIDQAGAEITTSYQAGLAYYTVAEGEGTITIANENTTADIDAWGHDKELYFSFGATQTLVTQDQALMQTFVDSNGYLGGFENNDANALVVLHADRALMQGGANTAIDFDGEWDSSILKNMNSIALVIVEDNGGIHITAELTANSEEIAMSVRNIVEGLVALKALDSDGGIEGDLIRNIRFENDGAVLRVEVPVAADQIAKLKDM